MDRMITKALKFICDLLAARYQRCGEQYGLHPHGSARCLTLKPNTWIFAVL